MMESPAGYLIAFLVALGVLITVHEFGHFWVARRLGVKVLRFSVGFGRPLLRRRGRDGTEYVLAAIPLGGYVKMLGEEEDEIPESERHRAFSSKPPLSRIAIAFAGPLFNFLFAILAFWLMYTLGVPGLRPVVGDVEPQGITARAGFRNEDLILRVDGRETPTWQTVQTALVEGMLARKVMEIEVETREGGRATRHLDLAGAGDPVEVESLFDTLGFRPWGPPAVLGEVLPDGAAAAAGLRAGDRIVAVDGEPIRYWTEWVKVVRGHPGQVLHLEVEREGRTLRLSMTPVLREGDDGPVGVAGVRLPERYVDRLYTVQRHGPFGALAKGVEKTFDTSLLMVKVLWKVVTGDASLKNISGPITIAQFAGESAAMGLVPFLSFLAVVSISLGVLNLMPVPILDGGHILFYAIELVRGRPVSEQAQLAGHRIGILLLLALMGLAFYNDFARLLG